MAAPAEAWLGKKTKKFPHVGSQEILEIFVLNYVPMRLISFNRFLKMESIDIIYIIEFSQLR